MITIRKQVRNFTSQEIEGLIEKGKIWMLNKYPDVNFNNVEFIVSATGNRARYFRNEEANANHQFPTVFLTAKRDYVMLYWKPSLGMVRDTVFDVGYEDALMCQIIHELTHHAQYEKDIRKGNETDTTQNELAWLKEFRPDVYELFTII